MQNKSPNPLISTRRRQRLELRQRGPTTVISLGPIEIWDGVELSLIRDTLFELILKQEKATVGIDLTWVKYIPSGFFGLLADWHDRGIQITLYSPQPNVKNMLWFQQFFADQGAGSYRLVDEPLRDMDDIEFEDDTRTPQSVWHEPPLRVDALAAPIYSSIGE